MSDILPKMVNFYIILEKLTRMELDIGWNLLIHAVEPEKEEENYEFSISLFLLWHNHKYQ